MRLILPEALASSIWFKVQIQGNSQTISNQPRKSSWTMLSLKQCAQDETRAGQEKDVLGAVSRTFPGDPSHSCSSLGWPHHWLCSHPPLTSFLLFSASFFCCRQGTRDPLAIFCFSQDRLQVYFIHGAPLRGQQFIQTEFEYLTQLEWRKQKVQLALMKTNIGYQWFAKWLNDTRHTPPLTVSLLSLPMTDDTNGAVL